MKNIDLQVYQTITKSLVEEQQHPYQPQQLNPSPTRYQTNKSEYDSIKQAILMMSLPHNQPPPAFNITTPNSFPEGFQHEIAEDEITARRHCTDDLLQQPQLSSFSPSVNKEFPNEKAKSKERQSKKGEKNQAQTLKKNIRKEINGFNMEDVILGPSNLPAGKQDYFKSIGGISGFKYDGKQKQRSLRSPKYPIIFISNLFMLLSLFTSISMNHQAIWIIQAGLSIVYFLLGYFSPLRERVFNMEAKGNLIQVYEKVVRYSGSFIFKIQCYHFSNKSDSQHKILTSSVSETVIPHSSFDQSFTVSQIEKNQRLFCISPKKCIIFKSKHSEQIFSCLFNSFVEKNSLDLYQKFSINFEVEDVNKMEGIYGENIYLWSFLYILSWFLLVPYLFALWFQCNLDRYQVIFVKRVSLQ